MSLSCKTAGVGSRIWKFRRLPPRIPPGPKNSDPEIHPYRSKGWGGASSLLGAFQSFYASKARGRNSTLMLLTASKYTKETSDYRNPMKSPEVFFVLHHLRHPMQYRNGRERWAEKLNIPGSILTTLRATWYFGTQIMAVGAIVWGKRILDVPLNPP